MCKLAYQVEYVQETLEDLAESCNNVIPVEKILQRCTNLLGSEIENVLNYLEDNGYLEIDDDFDNVSIIH